MSNKKLTVGLVIVLVIAIIGLFLPTLKGKVGAVSTATTNLPSLGLAGIQIGSGCDQQYSSCNGTSVSRLNTGTCYILAYATTIAATSTAQVDCQATAAVGTTNTNSATALTGVTLGDSVVASLATSTSGSTFAGLVLGGATASTTSGYITLRVSNLTGATFTWPTTGNATGTVSYVVTH